ncbi:hypothetical protein ABK040_015146 [Willaertia magna]
MPSSYSDFSDSEERLSNSEGLNSVEDDDGFFDDENSDNLYSDGSVESLDEPAFLSNPLPLLPTLKGEALQKQKEEKEKLRIEELEKDVQTMKVDNEKEELKQNITLQRILNEPTLTDDLSFGKELDDFLKELDSFSVDNDANNTPLLKEKINNSKNSILKYEREKKMDIFKTSVICKRLGKVLLMKMSKKFTAFGTEKGLVLVYSNEDYLSKCILGNIKKDEDRSENGKVTSIDFTEQEDWLIVGYEKGVIIVWDLQKGSIITRNNTSFTSPIVSVGSLCDNAFVASELHSGNLKLFIITKAFFNYSLTISQTVSIGDDAIISTSILRKTFGNFTFCFIAIATRSGKTYLYLYESSQLYRMGECLQFEDKFSLGALPYISWVNFQDGGLLAFAYSRYLSVYSVEKGKLEEKFNTETDGEVCGLGWFDDRNIIVITKELLLLYDIKADDPNLVDKEDIPNRPIAHTFTTGNHFSCTVSKDSFIILAEHEQIFVSICNWEERLSMLTDVGQWKEALDLVNDFLNGRGKSVVGLPSNPSSAQIILSQKAVQLITEYLQLSLVINNSAEDQVYQLVGGTCIEQCLKIGRTDLLFDKIFEIYSSKGKERIFINLIEPYILDNALKQIPWNVFELIISYLSGDRERLNSIIVKLDVLHFEKYNEIIKYCLDHVLLKAYVYAQTSCAREYIEPLETIYDLFGKKHERMVVDVFLYYLEQYLIGNIPESEEIIEDTKKDIVDFIFDEESVEADERDPTAVFHSIVKFYPERFFEIMEIAMNDDSSTSPWDEEFTPEGVIEYILRLQGQNQFMRHPSFYDGRIAFFSFYAKFLAKGILKANDYNILLVIFNYLSEDINKREKTTTEENERAKIQQLKADREERFIEILQKRETYYDKSKFMELAKKLGLYGLARFFMNTCQKYQWYLEVNLKRLFEIDWDMIPIITENLVEDNMFSNATHQHVVSVVLKLIDEEKDLERKKRYRFFLFCYLTSLLLDPTSEGSKSLKMEELELKRGIPTDELTYFYLQAMCEFEDNRKVKEFLKQQSGSIDLDRCLKICKDIPEAKSYLLERTGEVKHALNEIVREMDNTLDLFKSKLIEEVKRDGNKLFEQYYDIISKDFNRITDDPAVYTPNEPLLEQKKEMEKNPKIKLPAVTAEEGVDLSENANLCDVLLCEESRSLVKELKTAINLCCENSERKTLDDFEVRQLWFKLLNIFLGLQRKLRYGYLEGKPMPVLKEEPEIKPQKPLVLYDNLDFDEFLDDETDEYDIVKEEIIDTNNEIMKIEKKLNAERELQDPDEEKIETLQNKLKKKKEHVNNLHAQLKFLEEKEKLEKALEEEKNNDPRAPHNIHKLANLWLQRCNALYIRIVLSDMMRYVDIPSILNEIVNEHRIDPFGNIKVTILRMLDSYSYESGLLRQSNELISYDIYTIGSQLHKLLSNAVKPSTRHCHHCGNYLSKKDGVDFDNLIRIFPCGHAYHVSCLGVGKVYCINCETKDDKEAEYIAQTSKFLRMEKAAISEKQIMSREKFTDFYSLRRLVDKSLKKTTGFDLLEELSGKKGTFKKKNVADLALMQLGGVTSSSVTKLTGIKILSLAPPKENKYLMSPRSSSSTSKTLMTVDEEEDKQVKTEKPSTPSSTSNNNSRVAGMRPTCRIKILDFGDIVKEIDELYN